MLRRKAAELLGELADPNGAAAAAFHRVLLTVPRARASQDGVERPRTSQQDLTTAETRQPLTKVPDVQPPAVERHQVRPANPAPPTHKYLTEDQRARVNVAAEMLENARRLDARRERRTCGLISRFFWILRRKGLVGQEQPFCRGYIPGYFTRARWRKSAGTRY